MKNNKELFIRDIITMILIFVLFIMIVKFSFVFSSSDTLGEQTFSGDMVETNSSLEPIIDDSSSTEKKPITSNSYGNIETNTIDIGTPVDANVDAGISAEIPTKITPQVDANVDAGISAEIPTKITPQLDMSSGTGAGTSQGDLSNYNTEGYRVEGGRTFLSLVNQQISQKLNSGIEMIPEPIKKNIEKINKSINTTKKEAVEVVSSPLGQVVTKTATSVGVVAGASMTTSAILSADTFLVSDFFLGAIRFWGIILMALGLRKRNKEWGTVYSSVTKQPLDPVYVTLENLQNKEVASAITDMDGRYGFLIQQGSYKISVHKTNYEFPSKKVSGKKIDQIYPDLYFGDTIEISANGDVVSKNIPMDPIKFDWNEFEKNKRHLMKFYSKRNVLFIRIGDIIFNAGLLIALIMVAFIPNIYNVVALIIYIILCVLKYFVVKSRSYGSIIEKGSGDPLSFGIIHVKKSENEIIHKVADKFGRFYCLVQNGTYEIRIDKKTSEEDYSEVFRDEKYQVKNGSLNRRFEV